MSYRTTIISAWLLAAVTACGLPDNKSLATAQEPEVKVAASGTGNPAELRYALAPASTQAATITVTVTADADIDGTPTAATTLPTLQFPVTVTVDQVKDSGNVVCKFELGTPEVTTPSADSAMDQYFAEAVAELKGVKGKLTLTPRGHVYNLEINAPDRIANQTRQLVSSLHDALRGSFVLLPEGMVSPGARWTASAEVLVNEATVTEQRSYELVSVTGSVVQLRVTTTQQAKAQEVTPRGVPLSAPMKLHALQSQSLATYTIDLAKPLPVAGDSSAETTADLELTQADKTNRIKTQSKVRTVYVAK